MIIDKVYVVFRNSCMLGLALALLSFAPWGENKRYFGLLFVYFPVLWFIWIIFAISNYFKRETWKLLALWVVIDLAILALFVSFSLYVDNWTNSQGIDMAIGVTYAPIAGPLMVLIGAIPKAAKGVIISAITFRDGAFGTGTIAAVGAWLTMTILSIGQSIIILLVKQIVKVVAKR